MTGIASAAVAPRRNVWVRVSAPGDVTATGFLAGPSGAGVGEALGGDRWRGDDGRWAR
jgi:hypothetical protein